MVDNSDSNSMAIQIIRHTDGVGLSESITFGSLSKQKTPGFRRQGAFEHLRCSYSPRSDYVRRAAKSHGDFATVKYIGLKISTRDRS